MNDAYAAPRTCEVCGDPLRPDNRRHLRPRQAGVQQSRDRKRLPRGPRRQVRPKQKGEVRR